MKYDKYLPYGLSNVSLLQARPVHIHLPSAVIDEERTVLRFR